MLISTDMHDYDHRDITEKESMYYKQLLMQTGEIGMIGFVIDIITGLFPVDGKSFLEFGWNF